MFTMLRAHITDFVLLLIYKIKHTSVYVKVSRKLFTYVFLSGSVCLQSCLKDDLELDKLEDSSWQPELAVPLAFTSMSIRDLMKNETDSGTLVIDENNFCTLIYTGRAMNLNAQDLISIPDQHLTQQILLNDTIADAINQAGHLNFDYSQNFDFSFPNGALIDSVVYRGGNAHLNINCRIPANTILTLTIPGATKYGIPFTQVVPFIYTGSLPIIQQVDIDLADYEIDLSIGGTTHNQMRVDYNVDLTTVGVNINSNHKVNFNFNILSNNFKELYGYFGQQSVISENDTIEITLFNNLQGLGSFTIAEPEIKIDFVNSIGVPVHARAVSMTGLNANLTDFVVANGVPDPLPINSPTIGQIGQAITGSFSMDINNSNVGVMIDNQPKYLITQIESTTNPNGNTGLNFVTDSSRFAVDMEVKLPLYGTATDFLLRDTVNFNYANMQNVQSLTIRTSITNGFPLEALWQIYFTDENYTCLDSLVSSNPITMPSATVNPVTGRVVSPSLSTTDNTLDRTRILKIMSAKKLIIKAVASSTNHGSENVKIYADYTFDVTLGAIAKVIL